MTIVVVIAMGEMGAGIAKRLTSRGAQVRTSLKDRGSHSAARASAAGVDVVDNDDELIDSADFVLSVVPPAAARGMAARFAPALSAAARKPVYIDCNAISPATAAAVATIIAPTGAAFADGGILGFPPKEDDPGPRIYLSGPAAAEVARLRKFGLDLRVMDDKVGSASALKCSYAALGKGLTALGSLLILGAQRAGVDAALHEELAIYQPQILAWFRRWIPEMYGKSYRWIAEMEEIGVFLDAEPGGATTYRGIARMFEGMAVAGRTRETADNPIDAIEAFLARNPQAERDAC
jgi:L-threonate 2-dehydrogenase